MRNAPNGIRVLAALAAVLTVGLAAIAFALPVTNPRFASKCSPSHTRSDDPIVYPGKPGWSHEHQFFGARTTDAFSKPQQLRSARSSCSTEGDTAAYWVPTLRIGGKVVEPRIAVAYYTAGRKRRDLVRAFPPGLRMIAGKSDARRPQPERIASWYCVGPPKGVEGRDRNVIESALFQLAHAYTAAEHPNCEQPGETLSAQIRFADCWDGRRLDSADHRSHMAYAKRPTGARPSGCPVAHPVPVPKIVFTVHYPTRGEPDPRRIELSSGGVSSIHADFINSWDQGALVDHVRRCINLAAC